MCVNLQQRPDKDSTALTVGNWLAPDFMQSCKLVDLALHWPGTTRVQTGTFMECRFCTTLTSLRAVMLVHAT